MEEDGEINPTRIRLTDKQKSLAKRTALRSIEARKENEQLRNLVNHDTHLPNMLNLRGFREESLPLVEHVLNIEKERGFIIFIDVDGLKAVNDRYGHPTGDVILRKLSEMLIQETFRREEEKREGSPDIIAIHHEKEVEESLDKIENDKNSIYYEIARRGGDEFLVTVHSEQPEEGLQYITNSLNNVRLNFENWALSYTKEVKASFSYGIAEIGERLEGNFDREKIKQGNLKVVSLDKSNLQPTDALEYALEVAETRMYADKISRNQGRR